MKFKLLSLFLFLFLCAHLVTAQHYVIKMNGDSISGFIDRLGSEAIIIKPNSAPRLRVYWEGVSKYYNDGTLFTRREIYFKTGNKKLFVEQQLQGNVNLYSRSFSSSGVMVPMAGGAGMMTVGGGKSVSYYIDKTGGDRILHDPITPALTGEKRLMQVRAVLLAAMGDDQEIADQIQTIVYFSPKVVKQLVSEYNARHPLGGV